MLIYIMTVLKVETDIITSIAASLTERAVILVIMYVEIFTSVIVFVIVFIGDIKMCLMLHWQIIFNISQFFLGNSGPLKRQNEQRTQYFKDYEKSNSVPARSFSQGGPPALFQVTPSALFMTPCAFFMTPCPFSKSICLF